MESYKSLEDSKVTKSDSLFMPTKLTPNRKAVLRYSKSPRSSIHTKIKLLKDCSKENTSIVFEIAKESTIQSPPQSASTFTVAETPQSGEGDSVILGLSGTSLNTPVLGMTSVSAFCVSCSCYVETEVLNPTESIFSKLIEALISCCQRKNTTHTCPHCKRVLGICK